MMIIKVILKMKLSFSSVECCKIVCLDGGTVQCHLGQEFIVRITINIAKGTTDPRVEFISQDHSSQILNLLQFQNLDFKSINFKISTKHQHLD